jgi:hypothetical protein
MNRSFASLAFLLAAALLASGHAAGCPSGATDRIEGVSPQGDVLLRQRGPGRLAGIRLADDGPARASAHDWLRSLAGRPVAVERAFPPDRWGRTPVLLRWSDGPDCHEAGETLVRNGLAMIDPGPEDLARPELFAAEAHARERGLGVWADGRYKAVPVGQVDRLRERIGHFTLVEGRVRDVGERQERTYLNFGTDWASDFTIIIPKRVWSVMAARGLNRATLKARRIRARGILEERSGPALTIAVPEMIEALDDERAQR